MGWLASRFDKWAGKKQAQEICDFISRLKAMDSEEIGLVVATATNARHVLEQEGHDLMNPTVYLALRPEFTFSLSQTAIKFQKDGNYILAAALMVWIHTFRSGDRLELRQYGRDMWRELERGFPFVEDAALGYLQVTGIHLDYSDAEAFPSGLTPTPL
ncbi:hypothetical protein E1A40_08750 [Salmonella enterica subsp. enterica serovar Aba]|uniref:hypothetical protein n=1 Tax=Salmonella enterica TaxID=28901 RepID=UPI0012C026F9|nr:hypothetical protein [Salmonella enterica]EBX2183591.1 hypothetical protein [Salmonella enterica subsp. enterica serovar Aba]ECB3807395.1 hypothetical protein [Salmonella enterica subsp. enterica serovar Fufu]ECG5317595.1 hypothetical protein [Salmonella enterica subsp. enterica serovar Aba]HCL5132355.1 hypothetical protein [Salmonella enterica]